MNKEIKRLKKEITTLNLFVTLIFISTIINSSNSLGININYIKIILSAALISLIFVVRKELKKKLYMTKREKVQ